MSSHRAYINCMRCYELEGQISQEEDRLVKLRLKDSQHQARNEAMKVFEEQNPNPTDKYHKKMRPLANERGTHTYTLLKEDSLDACLACDYSKPSMAVLLKENDRNIQRALAAPESQEQAHNYRTNANQD